MVWTERTQTEEKTLGVKHDVLITLSTILPYLSIDDNSGKIEIPTILAFDDDILILSENREQIGEIIFTPKKPQKG
jgi:hypothetical protein